MYHNYLTMFLSINAQGSARYIGNIEPPNTDVAIPDEEMTAANSTSVMLEQSPTPDCELLRHRVDEDPRWDFGKFNKIFCV